MRGGGLLRAKKKWIFPGSTHSEHLHISGRPHRTSPFFFSRVPVVCLFFFLLLMVNCVYTHWIRNAIFFLFPYYAQRHVPIYYMHAVQRTLYLYRFFLFLIYLAPSLGKQTRLVRRTKYSLPGSHTPAELILGVTPM